jgi:Tol biopolymer transport system component
MTPGERLGSYEIVAAIGAGGMGEVYQARDTALGRDVAIKVLPPGFAGDPERLRRFVQEAQAAAALDHPNILAIYQIGQHGNAPYIVSELLKGSTIRDLLRNGPLPVRKAVDYAIQTARGLAAAHDKGIIHRDLKPDNLFVTADGRVKILDFGVAKLLIPEAAADRTMSVNTGEGTVLGTVGYMSPEQVRGQAVDARSDVFSLGAVLYEMLSGRRAFQKDSSADTVAAVLHEDPADLTSAERAIPPILERTLRRCLEKSPQERFQSARDVAFALEDLSSVSTHHTVMPDEAPAKWRPRTAYVMLAAAFAILTVGAAGVAFGRWDRVTVSQPTFRPVTFRRGTLLSARFAPSGDTIVYGAAWDGRKPETFAVTGTSPESRPLGFPNTDVYSISAKGELALSYRTTDPFPPTAGVLAEVPLLGGAAPREMHQGVEYADWAPDGSIAVTIDAGIGDRLEYPIGNTLYEINGPIHMIHVSADGTLVAFSERQEKGLAIATIDKAKKKTTLTTGWLAIDGLAWSPGGNEIWFSAKGPESGWGVYAVTRAGVLRTLLRTPGGFYLHDVAPDGRVLASEEKPSMGIRYMAPGADREEDLSWLDASSLRDLSADGRTILFTENGEASADGSSIYLRKGDGTPAVRLGSGVGWALSPDGKSVLASVRGQTGVSVMPTGPGATQRLKGDVRIESEAVWRADGHRVVYAGDDNQGKMRLYLQDLSGEPRPISPSGEVDGFSVSPDGSTVALTLDRKPMLLKLTDGTSQPLPSGKYYEVPIVWSSDGQSVFMADMLVGAAISRVDVPTGARTAWKTLLPSDSAGVTRVTTVRMRDDGRSYAYSYVRRLSQLFVISGLK